MARPRKEIDEDKLEQLASLGLSNAEIAAVLDVSPDTIERNYRETLDWGRNKRNASLRRKQYEIAMSGNPTMLIWLGKQFLEQSDKVDQNIAGKDGGPIQAAIAVTFVRTNGTPDNQG
jgi:hypothetical protein